MCAQDFEKAGTLRDREMELKAQISAITGAAKEGEAAEAEASAEGGGPLVTEADIANIVAQWTGIPVEKVCFLLWCSMQLLCSGFIRQRQEMWCGKWVGKSTVENGSNFTSRCLGVLLVVGSTCCT
jgi:hypothetical protein